MKCIFCQIANKEMKTKIIYENKDIVVFYDNAPENPGHALIVPKIHSNNILELSSSINLLENLEEITLEIKKEFDFKDFKLITNNGEKAGQEINHTHIHIIPYY